MFDFTGLWPFRVNGGHWPLGNHSADIQWQNSSQVWELYGNMPVGARPPMGNPNLKQKKTKKWKKKKRKRKGKSGKRFACLCQQSYHRKREKPHQFHACKVHPSIRSMQKQRKKLDIFFNVNGKLSQINCNVVCSFIFLNDDVLRHRVFGNNNQATALKPYQFSPYQLFFSVMENYYPVWKGLKNLTYCGNWIYQLLYIFLWRCWCLWCFS